MDAARPVRALVARRKLAIAEDLVCDLLRLDGELLVDLAGVDEERRLGDFEVLLQVIGSLQEGGMRDSDDVDVAREGEVEGETAAVAESDGTELGDARGLEGLDYGADEGVGPLWGVTAKPRPNVEVHTGLEGVRRSGLAIEDIWCDNLEAVARKVIGKELLGHRLYEFGSFFP